MFHNIDNFKLRYEEYGPKQGRVMLFLHGNGGNIHKFDKSREFFEGEMRVVLIDGRGHGESVYEDDIDIPLMADDVVSLVRGKGWSNIIIVGFSDGGNVALEAAARLKNTVKELVVIGANTRFDGLKLGAGLEIKLLYAFYSLMSFNKKYKKKRQIFSIMTKQPEILDATLKSITAKTLVVAGENDMIKDSHTREICAKIKGAKLNIIKGGSHFLISRNNDEINRLISDFISK